MLTFLSVHMLQLRPQKSGLDLVRSLRSHSFIITCNLAESCSKCGCDSCATIIWYWILTKITQLSNTGTYYSSERILYLCLRYKGICQAGADCDCNAVEGGHQKVVNWGADFVPWVVPFSYLTFPWKTHSLFLQWNESKVNLLSTQSEFGYN